MTNDRTPDEFFIGPMLDRWAERVGLAAHLGGTGVVRSWTDMVTASVLRPDGEDYVVEDREKGAVQTWARFGSAAEAETYL